MFALVFHGPGRIAWEEVPDPQLTQASDALVQIETTTICGTDLHILKGDVPAVQPGRILGHEGVGVVTAIGEDVRDIAIGDRVIVSCISKCGACDYCAADLPSHCRGAGGIGWLFGHLIDGTQAEYVRVPFADTSLVRVPEGVSDDQAVMLSDILPTGYEIGVRYGSVRLGDTVAVVGAGPVGLAAVMTAASTGAERIIAVDPDPARLARATEFGATDSLRVAPDESPDEVAEGLRYLTDDGLGVDVAIEAVGVPSTFTTCVEAVRPGGHVAIVGVHGVPVEFALQEQWIRNITLTTGLVNAVTTRDLLGQIAAGAIAPEKFATHHFALDEIEEAYEVFAHAAEHAALKVVLSAR